MAAAFACCALLTALLTAVAGVLASRAAPSMTALWLALAFVPYAGLLLARPPQRGRGALLWLAALAGAVLVLQPPVLSDDVHRYRWDARVLLAGVDPYAHAPDAPQLSSLRDDDWSRINHREVPTIYPPLAQLIFAVGFAPGALAGTSAGASIALFKLLALLMHLAAAALVYALARARDGSAAHALRALSLLALNPLALSEAALGGHVDVAMGACALLFAHALAGSCGGARAAVLAGLLSGLKLLGFALLPLLWPRGARWVALALVLSLAALLPLARAGHADPGAVSGIGHYAQRWRGNEGPFAMLDAAARALVDRVADADAAGADGRGAGMQQSQVGPAEIALPRLARLLATVSGGPLDPSGALRAERKQPRAPGVFDRGHLAGLLARAVAAAAVLALALVLTWRRVEPLLAARSVLLAVLLLAPQLHPWYLLWLLPLETALGRSTALVWSAVALVAYAPLDGWLVARSWQEPALARPLQYGLVLGVLALEHWWCRARPPVAQSAR
jgi:hypothetical protein